MGRRHCALVAILVLALINVACVCWPLITQQGQGQPGQAEVTAVAFS